MPIGSDGYIMFDSDNNGTKDSWRNCVASDGNIFSGTGNGVSINNIDQLTATRTGISTESNVTALITYSSSNEKSAANYVPNNDILIDKGSAPTNSVNVSPTELKTLNELVPQTGVGNFPDIGAIDQSNVWTPGIDWVPQENFDIVNALTLNQSCECQRRNFCIPQPNKWNHKYISG